MPIDGEQRDRRVRREQQHERQHDLDGRYRRCGPAGWRRARAAGRRGSCGSCARLTALGTHGVLLTIGGTTREKWRPNFDTPAPTHTATISSFKATIRSTEPSVAKKTSAGRYCSLRAARNTTLSRRPIDDEQADQRRTAASG